MYICINKHNFKEIHKKKIFFIFWPKLQKKMATWSRCNERSRKISRHRNTRFSDLGKNFIRGMQRKEHVDSAKPYRSFQNKKSFRRSSYFLFIFQQQRQYIFFSNSSNSYSIFIPFSLHSDQHSEILYEIPCE